jgi:hypothetical protein
LVGIVRLRTKTTEFSLVSWLHFKIPEIEPEETNSITMNYGDEKLIGVT